MKKQVLSLVAFMAFSVGAFANTIEIKEEVVVEEVAVVDDCAAEAMKMGDFIEAIGGSPELAYWYTNAYYDWCTAQAQ